MIEEPPKVLEGGSDIQTITAMDAWNRLEFLYWNYILNYLVDSLYNVYSMKRMTTELWESLDQKYKTKDIEVKKFIVDRFLDYNMVDSKMVINQIQEL